MAERRMEKRLLEHTKRPTNACLVLMVLSVFFHRYVVPCDYQQQECLVECSQEWRFWLDDFTFGLLLCLHFCLWQQAAVILLWMCVQCVLWVREKWKKTSLVKIVCFCLFIAFSTAPFLLPYYLLWPRFVDRLHNTIVEVELLRYDDVTGFFKSKYTNEISSISTFYRYNTEDVTLLCYAETHVPEMFHGSTINAQIDWYKDGKLFQPVKYNSGHLEKGFIAKPQHRTEIDGKTRLFYARRTLLLPLLSDEDFGEYACNVRFHYNAVSPYTGLQFQEGKENWHYFWVHKIQKVYTDVVAPPNAVVHLWVSHISRAHDDPDILVDYTLDDVPLHELLEGGDVENKCFSLLTLYKVFTTRSVLKTGNDPEHIQVPQKHKHSTINSDLYSLCASTKSFGIYRFNVWRYFYNGTTKTEDFLEAEYPLEVRLIPSFPGTFGRVPDNADNSTLDECWKDGKRVLSSYCIEQRSEMEHNLEIYGGLYAVCHGLLILGFPLLLLIYLYCVFKRIKVLLQEGSFQSCQVDTLCQVHLNKRTKSFKSPTDESRTSCDVFLSYHPNDSWASQSVKDLLRSRRLHVYDCHQDTPQGCPSLLAWDTALLNIHSAVVIVSPSYTACHDMSIQFQALNFHMISQQIAEERMVILVAEPCFISRELGPLPIINLQSKEARQQLEWWMRNVCSQQHPGISFKQVFADLKRDVKRLLCQSPPLTAARDRYIQSKPFHPTRHQTLQTAMTSDSVCRPSPQPTHDEKVENHDTADDACSMVAERQPFDLGHFSSRSGSMVSSEAPEALRAESKDLTFQSQNRSVSEISLRQALSLGGPSYTPPSNTKPKHDIFLTYCDESDYDSFIARKLMGCFKDQELRVFDANHDVLPGQEETLLVSAAAESAAFVLVISPEYCSHQIMRRLHYPRALQGVLTGRVSIDHVLIIISAGRPTFMENEKNHDGQGCHAQNTNTSQLHDQTSGLHQYTHADEVTRTKSHIDTDPGFMQMDTTLTSHTNQEIPRAFPPPQISALEPDVDLTADRQPETAEDSHGGLQPDPNAFWDNWRVPENVKGFPNVIYWSSNLGDDHHLEEVTRWSQKLFKAVALTVRDQRNQYLQNRAQRARHGPLSFLRHLAL